MHSRIPRLSLLFSALLIAVAPALMPDDYSWLSQSISESAAQGIEYAWIARLGFLFFAAAVMIIAIKQPEWSKLTRICHALFALGMVCTALFSHKPWDTNLTFNSFEDLVHSISATFIGFAFSLGIVFRIIHRYSQNASFEWFDVVALLSATALPLTGLWFNHYSGLLQRSMFLIAYIWYGRETLLKDKNTITTHYVK